MGNKESPLGVYRAAILKMVSRARDPRECKFRIMIDPKKRDKEASLFNVVFQKSLDGTATNDEDHANSNERSNKSSTETKEQDETQNAERETGLIGRLLKPKESRKGREAYNPYGNIAGETELLLEVKDIYHELNMLKSLALDQESVWKQIWKDGSNSGATFTYSKPSEVKKEITEMVKKAEIV